MSILTIGASNALMDTLRPAMDAAFAERKWRSEGVYTFWNCRARKDPGRI